MSEEVKDKVEGGEVPMTPELKKMFGKLEDLSWMNKDKEDVLKGTVVIFGTCHHVTLVRVRNDDGCVQVGTRDPYERLEDVLAGADGCGQTVEVPGFEGEWVVGVDPYRD